MPVFDVLDVLDRNKGLTGDESREGNGDGVRELVADDCFDCWLSASMIEGVADGSFAVGRGL